MTVIFASSLTFIFNLRHLFKGTEGTEPVFPFVFCFVFFLLVFGTREDSAPLLNSKNTTAMVTKLTTGADDVMFSNGGHF